MHALRCCNARSLANHVAGFTLLMLKLHLLHYKARFPSLPCNCHGHGMSFHRTAEVIVPSTLDKIWFGNGIVANDTQSSDICVALFRLGPLLVRLSTRKQLDRMQKVGFLNEIYQLSCMHVSVIAYTCLRCDQEPSLSDKCRDLEDEMDMKSIIIRWVILKHENVISTLSLAMFCTQS